MEPDKEWPIAAAADRIRRLRGERDAKLRKRRERAHQWSVEVAENLGNADFGIKRIIGFGSTFERWRNYREDSDVDLAMIGGDWSKAMSRIPLGAFEVSLIELDLQNDEFAEYVNKHGCVLYENSDAIEFGDYHHRFDQFLKRLKSDLVD